MPTPDKPRRPQHRQASTHKRARGGDGKYTKSIETAENDARAARLRVKGKTYQQIADELGYVDHTGALNAVRRALAAAPREAGAEAQQVELARLDKLVEAATRILETDHLAYNNKGVVEWEGAALKDDAPALAAVAALMRLSESRRKLLGLDAETKVALSGGVRYELVGVDPADITGSDPPTGAGE